VSRTDGVYEKPKCTMCTALQEVAQERVVREVMAIFNNSLDYERGVLRLCEGDFIEKMGIRFGVTHEHWSK
jgi:hypothetical protein